jgi:hypothetical protein
LEAFGQIKSNDEKRKFQTFKNGFIWYLIFAIWNFCQAILV